MLPGTYGLDILKAVRAAGSDVPVLVLSAKTDAAVKVRAFELGADDYLTKPFWPEELLARVQARLRRPLASTDGRLEVGTLALDPQARRAWAEGVPLELTRAEFDLLAALARRPGAAIERGWLAEHVLDPEREGSGRTLDVHVSRLRKKLGVLADRVETVWGVGYRLRVPE
jgi:two-component system response regulator MtrA